MTNNQDDSIEARRARLLDAASVLLVLQGPDGLSLRKISAMAEVSTMAIYSLFGGKEGLVSALFDEAFQRLLRYQENASQITDPLERLYVMGSAIRRFAVADPAYYALIMSEIMPIPEASQERAAAENRAAPVARSVVHRAAYHRLLDAVMQCCDQKIMNPEDNAAVLADAILATVHGLCSLEVAGYHDSASAARDRFFFTFEALLRGVLTEKGRRKMSTLRVRANTHQQDPVASYSSAQS